MSARGTRDPLIELYEKSLKPKMQNGWPADDHIEEIVKAKPTIVDKIAHLY